jgi:hypothetical protein
MYEKKKNTRKGAGGMAPMVECLPSKDEGPSTTTTKKKKKKSRKM